ncbi:MULTISPECIES: precorrin-6A synthase (deacetylating) [Rhodopseudomonas]|uniref:Precorrin-6A synthase [deacetylating] n=1 Tax=Rhodopseudomonas palustris TaxID=1076 RepID=A0A0D7F413_RHOPL|nr:MULTISPECIES: precorrin-6A synthase (deacetylating) [Rhodopseudomonas]KIZ46497.1 precorrin 6A synthase [Rhodopseudomonas palustris]MDF3814477.1 precorrin-6A synthase (deacetylating) [Rhodopseudomonas sp. BAL398]WOK18861.1 precorrin-6A synthase (deacetylating) [Rhodopseudomonas sp. BAL398]
MRKILVIGIGAGDPDFLTIQAVKALNRVDVFFVPDKGAEKAALRNLRSAICERFVERADYRTVAIDVPQRASSGNYQDDVDRWHAELADLYQQRFEACLSDGQVGGLLVWGDPALYDSTLRIIERVRAKGLALDYEVIPGISSVQVLAAKHRITLNQIGEPVLLTTGRKLAEGFPDDAGSVVVMLDGTQAFARLRDANLEIFWGAHLGTPDEILIAGPLDEVKDKIATIRQEARQRHGWIMDVYLLRRADR